MTPSSAKWNWALQAPVPPSGGDERAPPLFVMAEGVQLVLTERTRCAFRPG